MPANPSHPNPSPLEDDRATLKILVLQAQTLLVYGEVLSQGAGLAWLRLGEALTAASPDPVVCGQAYGHWFRVLAQQGLNWTDSLILALVRSANPWSQAAQAQDWPPGDRPPLPPALIQAAQQDLQTLQTLTQWDPQRLGLLVQQVTHSPQPPTPWHCPPQPLPAPGESLRLGADWAEAWEMLGRHYRHQGVGLWGQFWVVRWQGQGFQGVSQPDGVRLGQLVGYDPPKQQLIQNTEFLLAGHRALNVLLYGSRGSGKSSLIKALVPEYGDRGLRLLEVSKGHLQDLPRIVELLDALPQKFIIFVDDLSFEADDEAFKALKVVLEGSVTARSTNVVVYATSNRRHLVREYFGDRPRPQDADEIQTWDTVQEKLSFSDRFGLTLTFEPPDQDTYLAIVRHLARGAGLTLAGEALDGRACQWATRHNGRSGRSAQQFIDWVRAEESMESISKHPLT